MAISPNEDSDLESTRSAFDQAHDRPFARGVASPAPGDAELTTHALLNALVAATQDEEALIAVVDTCGFPLAQIRVPRPDDLPTAVVVGRHHRCDLVVKRGVELALRHYLFVLLAGRGDLRIRCVDLSRRADGPADASAPPHQGESSLCALGHLSFELGQAQFFLLPGGSAGQALLQGVPSEVLAKLRNNPTIDRASGFRPRSTTGSQPRALGSYRQDPRASNPSHGFLRLRGDSDERGRVPHRDVELRPQALRHGLVIGRHAERCTLAGEARNLSRMHALVCEEDENSLLVFDLASTNGVRPKDQAQGPSHAVVRMTPGQGCLLGQFHLDWLPRRPRIS